MHPQDTFESFFVTELLSQARTDCWARYRSSSVANYDLIIKGGRVIVPSRGLYTIRDVAVTKGHIATIEADIGNLAVVTIDARGKLVMPGLLGTHTHVTRIQDGPAICLSRSSAPLLCEWSVFIDECSSCLSM